jgi:hypothetical protein
MQQVFSKSQNVFYFRIARLKFKKMFSRLISSFLADVQYVGQEEYRFEFQEGLEYPLISFRQRRTFLEILLQKYNFRI